MLFRYRHSALLLLTATIWGTAFVAQSIGMDYVGPFTFTFARNVLAVLTLLLYLTLRKWVRSRGEGMGGEGREESAINASAKRASRKVLWLGGVCCGICLFAASNLQQFGILETDSVGKAGFITACYIVLVPVLEIFFKKPAALPIWTAVALAVAGLYLLCIQENVSISRGDLWVMLCAFAFAVHILVIDHFTNQADGAALSCIQFGVCAVCSGICMLLVEQPQLSDLLQAWLPIGYAGIFSSGVAYTLQIIGQKGMNPTVASLIMSLESVISVLAGWLLLGQRLSTKELFGCVLVAAAVVLAQLPISMKRRRS